MKKVMILLMVCMVLLLAGCQNYDSAPASPRQSGGFGMTAFAEGKQVVDAPTHVSDTYTSKTSKITVQVDADVIVPSAERVPIYLAELRLFTNEEVVDIAKAAFGNRKFVGNTKFQYEHLKDNNPAHDLEIYSVYLESSDGYTFQGGNGIYPKLGISSGAAMFDMPQSGNETYFPSGSIVRFTDQPPAGCAMTEDEARRTGDRIVAKFAPNHQCVAQAVMMADMLDENAEASNREAWVLYYTRKLDIPITYNSYGNSASDFNPYAPTTKDDCIIIVIDDDGVQGLYYEYPHEITGVIQQESELLPFEQIMEIAEAILPLKEMWLEQHYEDVQLNIYEIRLGYMRVISRNTQEFEYIPVWDFFGTEEVRQTKNGEVFISHERPFYSYLTINAIDGTVIDRNYGY